MRERIIFSEYQKGLSEGKFLGMKCTNCKTILFPARAVCVACGHTEMERYDLSGYGKLCTYTVIRVAPIGFIPPYVVAMVELDEGPWVIGNLLKQNLNKLGLSLIGCKVKLGSHQVMSSDIKGIHVLTFIIV